MDEAPGLDGAVPADSHDGGSGVYLFPAIGAVVMAATAGYAAAAGDMAWLLVAVIAVAAVASVGMSLLMVDDDRQAASNKAIGYSAIAMLSLAWALFRGQFPQQELVSVVGGVAALSGIFLWTYALLLVHRGYPPEGRDARYRMVIQCAGILLVFAGCVDLLATGSQAGLAPTAPGALMAGLAATLLQPRDKQAANDK